MYIYTHFWFVNPFKCTKLIVGIDGIDGKGISLNNSSVILSLYTKAFREVAVKFCK